VIDKLRGREVEESAAAFRPPARGCAVGVWSGTVRLSNFLYLSFVFIDILALFHRFLYFLALLRVPDQTSSAAALFPGERVASVASQVRGFFPSNFATSEFGFNSRIWCSNLGSFWVRFEFVFQTHHVFLITYWLRLYHFDFFSESYLPARSLSSGAGKSTSREVQEWPNASPSCDPNDGVDGWLPNSSTL
jgi:hypothetical protein